MYLLGISCFSSDSAVCLLKDGEILAACQEERFSRKKHDSRFPSKAIQWCLKANNISAKDLAAVAFYESPALKLRLRLKAGLKRAIGYSGKVIFFDHLQSHAASAFYPSPFKEAGILVVDSFKDAKTLGYGIGRGNKIKIIYQQKYPHSPGLLYSAFTQYLGFKADAGEYKVMGLAPYGEPRYIDVIFDKLVTSSDDGLFRLNMRYFNFTQQKLYNKKFERLFGGPGRKPETKISLRHMDIVASIQKASEEIMLKLVRRVKSAAAQENLCLAGTFALNCSVNGRILREKIFKDIWVQPASGEAGGALGAAFLAWHKHLRKKRFASGKRDLQKASLLGPDYSDKEIEDVLRKEGVTFIRLDHSRIPEKAAGLIARKKVVGWFQGRLEFGPRSLGNRSILADSRDHNMHRRMNLKVKFREPFRPFAPSVLNEEASQWFELDRESPCMLFVVPVRKDKRVEEEAMRFKGLDKLKMRKSVIPAVTHVDHSARVQTVKREDNPLFYDTIMCFFKKTGCPVIVNTSFNVRGEPLVCSPKDALRCFLRTDMDYLVMGSYIVSKKERV